MTSQSKEKEAFFTQNSLEIVSFLQTKLQRYLSGPMHPPYIMTPATCGFAPDSSVPPLAIYIGFAPGY